MKRNRPNKKNRYKQRLKISRDAVVSNEDLLTEILLRVPTKSLLRFKCVSKCWLSLISDPLFRSNHAHRNFNSLQPPFNMSEKNRRKICRNLFHTGVCLVKKKSLLEKHSIIDVPNEEVIRLMQSFKLEEYVKEDYSSLLYHCWYLFNDGIEYLRTYLNIPPKIMPRYKRSASPVYRHKQRW